MLHTRLQVCLLVIGCAAVNLVAAAALGWLTDCVRGKVCKHPDQTGAAALLWRRMAAMTIDKYIWMLPALPARVLLLPLDHEPNHLSHRELSFMMVSGVASLIWGFSYKVGMEARWGTTLGKMAFGLEVRTIKGDIPTLRESTVRNFLLLLEGSFLLLPATICLLATPRCQRIGDWAANTVVLQAGKLECFRNRSENMAGNR